MGGTEEGVPSEAQREGAPSGITDHRGKVPGHREKGCIRGTEGRGAMGGTQRRGTVGAFLSVPPAGSVPHPSSAPVKATLFSGCRKMRNSIIKAIQRKEVRNGSRERFVVPPQVGLTLAHAQLQTSVPIPPPHLRGRGVSPPQQTYSALS